MKNTPPPYITPVLKISPGGVFRNCFMMLIRAHGSGLDLSFLSFLLSADHSQFMGSFKYHKTLMKGGRFHAKGEANFSA